MRLGTVPVGDMPAGMLPKLSALRRLLRRTCSVPALLRQAIRLQGHHSDLVPSREFFSQAYTSTAQGMRPRIALLGDAAEGAAPGY